ncbi:Imm19 family immunity protein [Myroides odoratus]|uniref:Imm19 family immunity protein n=1 Tax=Myroides odoratus TaxID=256 RepID=UPI0039B03627
MNRQITNEDLRDNSFFWYAYISWFRGYDDSKEINIDEALEVIDIDRDKFQEWAKFFFADNKDNKASRFIERKLTGEISIYIEFNNDEIVFFINDLYIGNLGGHFEAYFLTWDELLAFKKFDNLFFLLLPMTGVEEHQVNEALALITKQLRAILKFENQAHYIATCILNGIKVEGQYYNQNQIGITNDQNHCIRNSKKYPRYKEDVIKLNNILSAFLCNQ